MLCADHRELIQEGRLHRPLREVVYTGSLTDEYCMIAQGHNFRDDELSAELQPHADRGCLVSWLTDSYDERVCRHYVYWGPCITEWERKQYIRWLFNVGCGISCQFVSCLSAPLSITHPLIPSSLHIVSWWKPYKPLIKLIMQENLLICQLP